MYLHEHLEGDKGKILYLFQMTLIFFLDNKSSIALHESSDLDLTVSLWKILLLSIFLQRRIKMFREIKLLADCHPV